MTVSELTDQLKNYPPDAEVCIIKSHSIYTLSLKPVCYICPSRYERILHHSSETSLNYNSDTTLTDITAVSDSEANCIILNTL